MPGEAQTLNLLDKDFKSVVLNILKELKKSIDEYLKKTYTHTHTKEQGMNKQK